MKKTFLLFAFLLAFAFGLQMFMACDDDDDDNDDNDTSEDDDNDDTADDDAADDDASAPDIPHEDYGQACTDCHSDAHDGQYTADDCLGCHSFAE
ncbi:MAG: hypothetical protein GX444_05425 [Myxococcales bacterium]|nr:hypothetical protein [Myxococcales bacterium]